MKFFLSVVSGVLASLDGPKRFWTVIEALISGFVAVEEVVAAFRCLQSSWLSALFD